jgi:hypothetical protein
MNFVYSKLFSLVIILFVLQLWSLPSLGADAEQIQRLERRIDNLERSLGQRIRHLEEKLRDYTQRLDRIAPIVDQHERRINEPHKRPSRALRVAPAAPPFYWPGQGPGGSPTGQ